MTALNKQALRQTAEKATPGPWEMEHENIWFRDTEGYTKHLMYAYQGDDVDDQQDHDNTAYIAAFNPKVVLALLDEMEAKDKRIEEEICRANREHHRGFMMACNHLKEHANIHYADAAEMEIAALRQRIAELEANKCKPVMFIDGDISPADADKLAAVIREFNEETETPAARMARIIRENPHPTNMCDMPAAGIGVKGD
ncbi:TPA: ead/Ea22-like family protein [Citrobacter freundii]|nr:ead/Ea22-like family protein [Citrobacter freundii]